MKDSFYTSTDLAEILVNYIGNCKINTVVDFCVGGGELLRAAQLKWANAVYIGTDISSQAISSLKLLHPDWEVDECDFVDENSRNKCSLITNKKFDLILLNPPFTCKGSAINKVIHNKTTYHVSTSMLFLVEALKYMAVDGQLFAILPISNAYSQKDKKIWDVLTDEYNLTILEEPKKQYFKHCTPNIIIVSLNNFASKNTKKMDKRLKIDVDIVSMFRGNLSMYQIKDYELKGKPLIHSTNLRNNKIEDIKYYINREQSEVNGPAVLIQRVGNPNIKKMCVIAKNESYVLSDCVIALKTKSYKEAIKLLDILVENWDDFKLIYKGTGAKYVTIDRLAKFLGFNISIPKPNNVEPNYISNSLIELQ